MKSDLVVLPYFAQIVDI